MTNLIEIDGDYVRSDLIAAVHVEPADVGESWELVIYLTCREEPVRYPFETYEAAEKEQVQVVNKWLESLAKR